MGLMMSFSLTLIGLLSASRFTIQTFLINFVISFVVSMILSHIIPIRKITMAICAKADLRPGSLKARAFEALVSDLSYTPIMTSIMVFMAYRQAVSHGAKIPFLPMLLRSLTISIFFAYLLIFFCTPLLMKIAFKDTKGERR